MPKAPAKSRTKTSRIEPTKAANKTKDSKASHLYTDDNPTTTIHPTGFKNKETAERTLQLIRNRSLIYQYQTVNAMYNRAKHHPAMKKKSAEGTTDMKTAMEIFRNWLDVTYPAEKDALRAGGFKPLLSKKCMLRYASQIEQSKSVNPDAKTFCRIYAELPKGKKLGNVLVDESKPAEPDWERKRYDALNSLVPAGKEGGGDAWKPSELWTDDREVSAQHFELVAWAWSPAGESKLP